MRHTLRSAEHRRGRVAICGSMRHYSLMRSLVEILGAAGIVAVAPEPDTDYPLTHDEAKSAKRESSLRHFRLIQERATVAVLVVNPSKGDEDSYLGPNSFAEIAIAFAEELPVYLLFDIPARYAEELEAWGVTALNGEIAPFLEQIIGSTLYADQLQDDLYRAVVS